LKKTRGNCGDKNTSSGLETRAFYFLININ